MGDYDIKNLNIINYIGRDYSPINDAYVFCDSEPWNANNVLGKEQSDLKNILIKFLNAINDRITNGDLVVGEQYKFKDNYSPKYIYKNDKDARFQGIVGVISDDIDYNGKKLRINLQIISRMDENYDKPYFLANLLLKNKIVMGNGEAPHNNSAMYDYLLLATFKEQLRVAFLKGIFKTYRNFEDNNERIKGTIDIARHIRLNVGQNNGKIAYSYREKTANNYLNHMIIAAYEHLKIKYTDIVSENFDDNQDYRSIIDTIKNEIGYSNFSLKELLAKNMTPISHPYYTEYEQLRITCIKILRSDDFTIFDQTESDTTNAMLFYLPDAWEEFLENEISKALKTCNEAKDLAIKPQDEIYVFRVNGSSENTYIQNTRPDFVFESKNKKFLILDAKFKPKWGEAFKSWAKSEGESNELKKIPLGDYDKCLRDMVDINAFATGVIFPVLDEDNGKIIQESVVCHSISKFNLNSLFYTIPINIPGTASFEDYESWKRKLDDNLNENMNKLVEIILAERKYYDDNINQLERRVN